MPFIFILFFIACQFSFAAERSIPVTTRALADVAIYPSMSIPASVISLNEGQLSAEVSAVIKKISVRVGNIVKAGTVLVKLDNRDYTLSVLQAEAKLKSIDASLELAHFELQRAEKLSKRNLVSQEVYTKREAEHISREAEREGQLAAVTRARRDLDKTMVRAPYTAVIVERLASEGELATPGTPLLRIIDAARLELTGKVQAQDVTSLTTADHMQFECQGKEYPVSLRVVTPVFNAAERNREVRLTFSGKAPLPGAFGRLVWQSKTPFVPSDLIVRRKKELGIFVAEQGKAVFYPLAGALEGRPAAFDLNLDQKIIVNGRYNIQNGNTISE